MSDTMTKEDINALEAIKSNKDLPIEQRAQAQRNLRSAKPIFEQDKYKHRKQQAKKLPTVLTDIRIIEFSDTDHSIPVKLPRYKRFICWLFKIEPNTKLFTRGYVHIADAQMKLWPGCIIRTKEHKIDMVLMGNSDGNKYLYASVTGIDDPNKLYKETRATYIGTTELQQPKKNNRGKTSKKITSSKEGDTEKSVQKIYK